MKKLKIILILMGTVILIVSCTQEPMTRDELLKKDIIKYTRDRGELSRKYINKFGKITETETIEVLLDGIDMMLYLDEAKTEAYTILKIDADVFGIALDSNDLEGHQGFAKVSDLIETHGIPDEKIDMSVNTVMEYESELDDDVIYFYITEGNASEDLIINAYVTSRTTMDALIKKIEVSNLFRKTEKIIDDAEEKSKDNETEQKQETENKEESRVDNRKSIEKEGQFEETSEAEIKTETQNNDLDQEIINEYGKESALLVKAWEKVQNEEPKLIEENEDYELFEYSNGIKMRIESLGYEIEEKVYLDVFMVMSAPDISTAKLISAAFTNETGQVLDIEAIEASIMEDDGYIVDTIFMERDTNGLVGNDERFDAFFLSEEGYIYIPTNITFKYYID